eukprot:8987486-Pyramimonas_sp.AAC.1
MTATAPPREPQTDNSLIDVSLLGVLLSPPDASCSRQDPPTVGTAQEGIPKDTHDWHVQARTPPAPHGAASGRRAKSRANGTGCTRRPFFWASLGRPLPVFCFGSVRGVCCAK